MGSFDAEDEDNRASGEPGGIPERIGDTSEEHAPAAASDGTTDRPVEGGEEARPDLDTHAGIDGPGVPDTAAAAAGPTQATTSGSGPAPAAGQAATHAGLTDSVAASEETATAPTDRDVTEPEPGANGGLSSEADPVTELAEDLGLAPGASDAVDAGQDNGLSS